MDTWGITGRAVRVGLVAVLLVLAGPSAAGAASFADGAQVGPVAAPSVAFTPRGRLAGFAVPLTVSWPPAAPSGAPLNHYELERSLNGGPWLRITLPRPRAREVVAKTAPWAVVRFRLRAVDTNGQPTDWVESAPRWMTTAQEADDAVQLSSTWQVLRDKAAYGRNRAATATAGATASFEFVGREVAWVARLGPAQGQADVSVDGGPPTQVNLYRSSGSSRRIVFSQSWPTVGPHSLVVTTSSGAPVDVDAFAVLADPTDGSLVGAGDIAVCTTSYDSATAALMSEQLAANESAIAFTAGDNVYPDGSPENFQNCYDPTWGAFKSRTRPVLGNHDFYNNPGAAGYFNYFGANAGTPGEGWYRYEAGTWRVYALSSECAATSACYTAQYNWLKADLIAEPHACVMAIWHRPLFSTGPHGNSARMASVFQLLYEHGAELAITGHDHSYQRFAPADATGTVVPGRGIRQFVVATGGASLYGFPTDSPLAEVRDNSSHGVLKLTLKPGSYAWEFLPVAGDTFTDASADTCH